MLISVEGCMHGELDNVYATLNFLEAEKKIKIDLLICCGDFEAVRNEKDLESMNVPHRYRRMNSFWKYYSGQEVAPYPTIFIGGNHEASAYLSELYYGGWAAPNIYFLGYAGVVNYGGVRIGGLSGIYNPRHYHQGHYERPPYDSNDIRSVYHVRHYDVQKLMQIEEPMDIFVSHDWPCGITDYGDSGLLLRRKPFFEREVREKSLGSPPAMELLAKLRPSYWFSAHLHCKFSALVRHDPVRVTRFLALDKCLPGRDFLQVVEVEPRGASLSSFSPALLAYDEEWLAITRRFHGLFPSGHGRAALVFEGGGREREESLDWVRKKLQASPSSRTAPPFEPPAAAATAPLANPQTRALLELLELSPVSYMTSADYKVPSDEGIPIDDGELLEGEGAPIESGL